MNTTKYLLCITAILGSLRVFSQQVSSDKPLQQATLNNSKRMPLDSTKQKDIIDILQKLLDKRSSPEKRQLPKKVNYSFIPYGGYTLSTGFTADISANVGFFTSSNHQQNLSVLAVDFGYDSKIQKLFRSRSEIWANENSYKFVADIRYEIYPTNTYGLGTFTTSAMNNDIDYRYVRVYGTVLKRIANNYYAGMGYNLDYHYDITADGNLANPVSDFMMYGQTLSSRSSGINFDFLYDDRKNSINPLTGTFANVIYRENLTVLGSDASWRSIQFDFRKYIKLSSRSNNVLALWSIMTFTWGNVPYLDLPATGSDMYNNSGRGYAIGRFRGRNMLYLEGEYRFGITRNGLLGAVVFANSESFSELQSNTFEGVAPAAGTGIRIKLNKHSNTNIGIDYGVGNMGSHGFFVNLGEVF